MRRTLEFLGARRGSEGGDVVLTGVPYDGTASFRPGARFGPQAMRIWSDVLETYSPAFDADLADIDLVDAGDLEISSSDWETTSRSVASAVRSCIHGGTIPLLLGGEHLITLPAVKEVVDGHRDLVVIQMDAHMDLRDEYQGLTCSHATVMRRVMETLGHGRLLQFGVRSGTREEWQLARSEDTLFTDIEALRDAVGARPVYLSLDLDVLDPSILPETGTPEPGGLTFSELHESLLALRGLSIVAADVMEYCPLPGGGGPSGAVAAKAVRELVFLAAEGRGKRGEGRRKREEGAGERE